MCIPEDIPHQNPAMPECLFQTLGVQNYKKQIPVDCKPLSVSYFVTVPQPISHHPQTEILMEVDSEYETCRKSFVNYPKAMFF